MFIEDDGEGNDFWAYGYSIPVNFTGKKIELTGYIKTENVTNGYAGLWMRLDPSAGFDNMNNRGVTGTTDWKQFKIKLPLNAEKSQQVVVGGLLTGTGKMWLDQLEVSVDGKPLEEAQRRELSKAELDIEFDQGSGIDLAPVNNQLIENLTVLGKIWGLMKYYHPAIANGDYNFDYELFRVLKPIATAQTAKERDALILDWIAKYGEVTPCKACKKADEDAVLKPDFKWITNGVMLW